MNTANAIKSRQIDFGIGGGVESMSLFAFGDAVKVEAISPLVFEHPKARNCLMPMGVTSENVAEKFGVTRQMQDQLAVDSHTKAVKATKDLMKEITPYTTTVKDADGKEK
jgi:acetyl-CoA acyltransferase 1